MLMTLRARIEALLSHAIRTNPKVDQLSAEVQGRLLTVRVTGIAAPLNILVTSAESVMLPCGDVTPDVTVQGSLPALGAFLLGIEPRTDALKESVDISGNAHLARRFQELFQGISLDGEEMLAQAIGDLPAHRLGNLARNGVSSVRQAAGTVAANLLEHLQYESGRLPAPEEWRAFAADLEQLGVAIGAAERRLESIAARLK